MSRIRVTTFFCLLTGLLYGQTDTSFIRIFQESAFMPNQRLIDRFESVFGTRTPTKIMLKGHISSDDPRSVAIGLGSTTPTLFNISLEYKVRPGLSLELGAGTGFLELPDPRDTSVYVISPGDTSYGYGINDYLPLRYFLQARWYYDMPGRIRAGLAANNFSGNYIGFESDYQEARKNLSRPNQIDGWEKRLFTLRYGLQRRFFRYGYIDVSYGIGARQTTYISEGTPAPTPEWNFVATSRLILGIGLTPAQKSVDIDRCDWQSCFLEEKSRLKIDLYNILRIYDFDNVKSKISTAYERKIGTSQISVEYRIQAQGFKVTEITPVTRSVVKGWAVDAALQPRYYFLQRRQIARGKSGNNLNGFYVAGQAAYWLAQDRDTGVFGARPYVRDSKYRYFQSGLYAGYQVRLFEGGFIDLYLGNTWFFGREVSRSGANEYTDTQPFGGIDGNLRVGLAF